VDSSLPAHPGRVARASSAISWSDSCPVAIIERSALISLVPAPRQVSRYPRTASRDRRAITTFYILNISL
jgi:hypothetical protein